MEELGGRGRRGSDGAIIACLAGRAVGARAKTCRGSRCARSWWLKWRTTTCRATGFDTLRSFAGGEMIRSRAIARLRNWKWFRRRSWQRFFLPGGRFSFAFRRNLLSRRAKSARRIVIRIGSFLRGPIRFRHVSQVHANPCPSGILAAHGIDEHVVDGKQLGGAQCVCTSIAPGLPARPPCRENWPP